ncbi:MAG: UbiA prenyltransferase family protein [Chloroflexota bacterium]
MRPRQLPKNGLVMVALFFTVNKWWSPDDVGGMAGLVGASLAATLIFSLVSGAVYIVNDLFDLKSDRAHPVKRNRPMASGQVPPALGLVVASAVFVAGVWGAFLLSMPFGLLILGYIAQSQAYNFVLKHAVILDVGTVAAGFVLRAVAGSLAIDGYEIGPPGETVTLDLTVSPWLYVCTGAGALFIALSKRRAELMQAGDDAERQRSILREYSLDFIDRLLPITVTSALIAYTLYTFSGSFVVEANLPDNDSMMFTIPFVAYGLFRYLYLVHQKGMGQSPEDMLLQDRPLLATVVLWLLTAGGVLLVNARNGI